MTNWSRWSPRAKQGVAAQLCVDALLTGAPFHIGGEHERPQDLVTIDRRRVGIADKRGFQTFGGRGPVARLEAEGQLSVGTVTAPKQNIVVFLHGDAARCVGCWAIPNDLPVDQA